MRYSVRLNDEMFEFVCRYQALDSKGREAVLDLIQSEEERREKERNLTGYTVSDMERDLEIAEYEIGFEFC